MLLRDETPIRVPSLSFEIVTINDHEYWLPLFYVLRDGLIDGCPKCTDDPPTSLTLDAWQAMCEGYVEEALQQSANADDGE